MRRTRSPARTWIRWPPAPRRGEVDPDARSRGACVDRFADAGRFGACRPSGCAGALGGGRRGRHDPAEAGGGRGRSRSRPRARSCAGPGRRQGAPELPTDIDLIERTVLETGARLVIVDPLMAFLIGAVDAYRDQHVPPCATPVERTGRAYRRVRARRATSEQGDGRSCRLPGWWLDRHHRGRPYWTRRRRRSPGRVPPGGRGREVQSRGDPGGARVPAPPGRAARLRPHRLGGATMAIRPTSSCACSTQTRRESRPKPRST